VSPADPLRADAPRIDAHVHLWDLATDPQDWIDPATMGPIARDFGPPELDAMLAATSCDGAVVVQAGNSLDETIRLTRLDATSIAGVVGWVDVAGDVPAQLAAVRDGARHRLVGIRHLAHIDPDPRWLERDEVGAALRVLAREGLAFDLVLRRAQLPLATALAARHPDVRFVLDHLGDAPAGRVELAEGAAAIGRLAERPNVTAKLSGLTSWLRPGAWTTADLEPVVEVAFRAFGARRLAYGSDWPLAELGGGAPAWRAAAGELVATFAAGDERHVFGAVAVETYGLD